MLSLTPRELCELLCGKDLRRGDIVLHGEPNLIEALDATKGGPTTHRLLALVPVTAFDSAIFA